jgi:hypothetical protein
MSDHESNLDDPRSEELPAPRPLADIDIATLTRSIAALSASVASVATSTIAMRAEIDALRHEMIDMRQGDDSDQDEAEHCESMTPACRPATHQPLCSTAPHQPLCSTAQHQPLCSTATSSKSASIPTTPTTPVRTPATPKIERFGGSGDKTEPSAWIRIYEHTTDDLTDKQRIRILASCISGEVLTWFADEIAGRHELDWDDVRDKFLRRYGTAIINPAVAAERRRLSKSEPVRAYAADKMRLLRLTGMGETSTLALLTAGMLPQYRLALLANDPADYDGWLRIALALESEEVRASGLNARTAVYATETDINAFEHRKSAAQAKNDGDPPWPCHMCKRRGRIAKHWHEDCPMQAKSGYEDDEDDAN